MAGTTPDPTDRGDLQIKSAIKSKVNTTWYTDVRAWARASSGEWLQCDPKVTLYHNQTVAGGPEYMDPDAASGLDRWRRSLATAIQPNLAMVECVFADASFVERTLSCTMPVTLIEKSSATKEADGPEFDLLVKRRLADLIVQVCNIQGTKLGLPVAKLFRLPPREPIIMHMKKKGEQYTAIFTELTDAISVEVHMDFQGGFHLKKACKIPDSADGNADESLVRHLPDEAFRRAKHRLSRKAGLDLDERRNS
jgi:hypothetical protein